MPEFIITADGSHTLYIKDIDEYYHSRYGAITESRHVFIDAGLRYLDRKKLRIFEMGFGTGLNTFLTLVESEDTGMDVRYTTVEKYPLTKKEVGMLNYPDFFQEKYRDYFYRIHECDWDKPIEIKDNFQFFKARTDILSYRIREPVDIVYYDAFAPDIQPGVWTKTIFEMIYHALAPGGLLTTYAVKGEVRRVLQSAGFIVEKLPGPPGKREMLRAHKGL